MNNFNSALIQEPSFPTEAEVCSYFPQEEWVVMTDFEKMSFRSIFHNYNMMKVLGFNPQKPQFMIHSSQKSSLKRKEDKSNGPVPGKKTHQEMSETKAIINDKSKYEEAETIATALKNKSIQMHNVFCEVLRVYLSYNSIIKGSYFNQKMLKRKILTNAVNKKEDCKDIKSSEKRLSLDTEALKMQIISDSDIDKNARNYKKIQVGDKGIIYSRNKHLEAKCNEENIRFKAAGSKIKSNEADGGISVEKTVPQDLENILKEDEMEIFAFSDLSDQETDEMCKKTVEEKPETTLITTNPQDQGHVETADTSGESVSERRYPRRNVPVLNYTESELIEDDEYLFCDICDREYEGDCPVHGPHTIFHDNYAPVTGEEGRAEKTSPAVVHVAKSKIPGGGSGVWTTVGLPGHARLGPYEGKRSDQPDPLGYSWTILKNRKVDHYIAADSTVTSNWMRFVNCARHESEQNLMAFQYKGHLYYRTVKPVPPKAELFVWYGKEYAEKLGISLESFRSRNTSHLKDLEFPCEKCNTTYTSPLYLENHRKWCRANRGPKVLVEPDSLPSDVRTLGSVRDGKKVYSCPVCQYETGLSHDMQRHLLVHTGQKPHTCDVCGKGFTQTSNLITHKRIHSGEKQFKCTVCTYSCNLSGNLHTHMKQHTGEKPYSCSQCQYRTVQSSNLTTHIRAVHSGLKPYSCSQCQYRAVQSSNLTRHIRAVHSGLKPYSCSQCQYRAVQSSHLTDHIRAVHSGLKPYSCPHCCYSTALKPQLTRHMKRKHSQ